MERPHYSNEINFGHILQAAVSLVIIGGGLVTGYISLRGDVASLHTTMSVQMAADEARLAEAELRLTLDEEQMKKLTEDDSASRSRIQAEIDKAVDAISDLRVQIAERGRHG
jgi:hypothetical protein